LELPISNTQLFEDVLRDVLVDFAVPGNRLCRAGAGIAPPIVTSAMSNQNATGLF
jgi:hypothetical protein